MSIEFSYKLTDKYDKRAEMFANGALVGSLSTAPANPEILIWMPDPYNPSIRFQFRVESTFNAIIDELKRYKEEHGLKYIAISSYSGGFAAKLDSEMLEKAGFKPLPEHNPNLLFLE